MKLTEARAVFAELRTQESNIVVYPHAHLVHPERKFTEAELRTLVMQATGILSLNNYPTAVEGSFLFICRDEKKRNVEIAILLEGKILVIHAFRRIK